MKQEVDIFMHQYLTSEGVEKTKKEELQKLLDEEKSLEDEREQWRIEEARAAKQIGLLSAQREMKAREASKALQHERETKEELKVKKLMLLDLSKKCHETNARLKEFSALYDVVKNERNTYVNAIQASSQALAEMKEKIKILQNEVEILQNESSAKDKALNKERLAHQTAQVQRDTLRLEANKAHAEYRQRQETVEQQIVEIDKLNSIINAMEKEMLTLKQQYETAVDARNYTGIQLIDRNDELCILCVLCAVVLLPPPCANSRGTAHLQVRKVKHPRVYAAHRRGVHARGGPGGAHAEDPGDRAGAGDRGHAQADPEDAAVRGADLGAAAPVGHGA